MKTSELNQYKRIMIVGCAGSGKSWFSKHIVELTGVPVIHLDNEFWLPGWTKPSKEEWLSKQNRLINHEEWIIDGNYTDTMELRFAAADLVVFLDMNRFLCIWSVFKRTGKKRDDLPDYLDEPSPLSREFMEFCKDIWAFHQMDRITILELHEKYPKIPFWQIKSRRRIKKTIKLSGK